MLQSKAWLHFAYMQYRECIDAGGEDAELLRGLDKQVAISNLVVALNGLNCTGQSAEARALADRLEPVADRLGHAGPLLFVTPPPLRAGPDAPGRLRGLPRPG